MPPRPALPRREAAELSLVLFAATLLLLWPEEGRWAAIGGDPLGETDNHVWMFWRAALAPDGPVANVPEGVALPLMDPFNLLLYLPWGWISPVAGWWGLRVGSVILAGIGGYALGRVVGSHRASLVGAVALMSAPFFGGMLDFGITESWPVGLFSLHVAALWAHARRGRVWTAAAAGVTLGALALCGWYFAVLALVVELLVVPALWWRHRRWGLWAQGALGFAMALPRFVAFLDQRGHWSVRWYPPSAEAPPPLLEWRDLAVRGTDLLNLALPHPDILHPGRTSYLGLVTLALAGVGLVRRPRVAGPLCAAAAVFCVLALGYWPRVAGEPIGVAGPPWWLVSVAPQMLGLSHWERALAGAVPFLAAAAVVGADHPRLRSAPAVAALCLALLVDAVAWSGTAWPRTAIPLEAPPSLATLPGEGALVQLPFDNGRQPFSADPARLYNRWQVAVGRPVAENYEGPDALLAGSRLVAALDASCGLRSTLPPYYQPPPHMRDPPPPDPSEVEHERRALARIGVEWVVLHRERCPRAPRTIGLAEELLGGGQALAGGDWAWPVVAP